MGNMGKRHLLQGVFLLLAAVWLSLWGVSSFAMGAVLGLQRFGYRSNQVIVSLQSGKSEKDLAAFLNKTGGKVVNRLPGLNAYTVEMAGGGELADIVMSAKSRHLQSDSALKNIQYNNLYYPMDIPNDPLYPVGTDTAHAGYLTGQYQLQPDKTDTSLQHIYAPDAWNIQKGSDRVVVAVLDIGIRDRVGTDSKSVVRHPHPDLVNRLLTDGVNIADGTADPSPSVALGFEGAHGTHVAGIIAAQGGNSLGVTGICWNNVWILPIKVFSKDLAATSDDIVAAGLQYCIDYKNTTKFPGEAPLKVNVINMSLGGGSRSDVMETMVARAAKAGIVMVAASGNDWDLGAYGVGYPAAYDQVIAVGATDYTDTITNYSQRGPQICIAAPGDQILSTVFMPTALDSTYPPANGRMQGALDTYGNGYAYMSGTSMACPCVSGAAALLMSQGVPADDVRGILQETAIPKGSGLPNDDYGYGLLNVAAALKKASIDVTVNSPAAASVVSTTRPAVRIDFRHAKISSIRVKIDGVLAIGPASENPSMGYLSNAAVDASDPKNLINTVLFTLDSSAGKTYISFRPDAPGLSTGVHTIQASADTDLTMANTATVLPTVTATSEFSVSPSVLSKGWHLFSVPYRFDVPLLPENVLGNSGLLARWNYASSSTASYAIYSLDGSRTDAESSFTPPSATNGKTVYSTSSPTITGAPAGLGYWLYVSSDSGVIVPDAAGKNVDGSPYVVNLNAGWNMVGDPFAFAVDWSGVIVEYNGQRASIADAVDNGWLYRYVYSWDNANGKYTTMPTSSAYMSPWEAQWVRVDKSGSGWPTPDVKLIISPNPHVGSNQ